jgi:hypothetical protein
MLILCSIFVLGTGCSSSRDFSQSPLPTEKMAPLNDYEKTFNPILYSKDIATVNEKDTIQKSQDAFILPSPDTVEVQEEIVQGFRIQLFSSSDFEEANQFKVSLQERLVSDSVYIVFDPPVYKVRVGDYSTRYEANQRLLYYIDLGYRDAWVVPDRVYQRKRVMPQSSDNQF